MPRLHHQIYRHKFLLKASPIRTGHASPLHHTPARHHLDWKPLKGAKELIPCQPLTVQDDFRRRPAKSRLLALLVLLVLCAASLACWSSDTLIIPPTSTPTLTPVPPTPDFAGKYKIGDSVTLVTSGIAPLYLAVRPEPLGRGNRVPNAACYNGNVVTVIGVQRVNNVTYYQITCNSQPGWVSEDILSKGQP